MPRAFEERMLGGDSTNITEFWDAMQDNPANGQYLKELLDYRPHCVPLALHGDGVPIAVAFRAGVS